MWKLLHISILLSLYCNKNVFSIRIETYEPEDEQKLYNSNLSYSNAPADIKNKEEEASATHNKKILSQPLAFSYNKVHEDVKAKPKNEKHKSGGGKSHYSDHKSSSGEKGKKGHKGFHDEEHSKKGHHDKEGHKGSYKDHGGKKKKQFNEHDFEGEHHKGEKGEKHYKFEEGGEHKKGHSTKGAHNINKKNHYEKKHEFFDEYYEDGNTEKHGAHHSSKDYHKGGSKKGSHGNSAHHEDHYGKKGHHKKGKHYSEDKGHKKAAGHEEHHKHDEKYGKKGAKKGGKKWGFSHGDEGKSKKGKLTDDSDRSSSKSELKKKKFVPTLEYLQNIPNSAVEHNENEEEEKEAGDKVQNVEVEHLKDRESLENSADEKKPADDESDESGARSKLVLITAPNEEKEEEENTDGVKKIQYEKSKLLNSENGFPVRYGDFRKSEDKLKAYDSARDYHKKEFVPKINYYKTRPKDVIKSIDEQSEEEDNTEGAGEEIQHQRNYERPNSEANRPEHYRNFQESKDKLRADFHKKTFVPQIKYFTTRPKEVTERIDEEREEEDNTEGGGEQILNKKNYELSNSEANRPERYVNVQESEDKLRADFYKKTFVPQIKYFKTRPKDVTERIDEQIDEEDNTEGGGEKIQNKKNYELSNSEANRPEHQYVNVQESENKLRADFHKKTFVPQIKYFKTRPNEATEHIEQEEEEGNNELANRDENPQERHKDFQESEDKLSADDNTRSDYRKKTDAPEIKYFETTPRVTEYVEQREEEGREKTQHGKNELLNSEGDFQERYKNFLNNEETSFVSGNDYFTTSAPKHTERKENEEDGEGANSEINEESQYKGKDGRLLNGEGFPKSNRNFRKSEENITTDENSDSERSSTQSDSHKQKVAAPKQYLEKLSSPGTFKEYNRVEDNKKHQYRKEEVANSQDSLPKIKRRMRKPKKKCPNKTIQENKENEVFDKLATVIKSPIPSYNQARSVRKANNLLLLPKDRMYINKMLFKRLADRTGT